MMPGFGAHVAGSEERVRQQGRLALIVLLGAFGTFGLFAGTFAVLLADLSRALDLSLGRSGSPYSWGQLPPSSRWHFWDGLRTGWGGRCS